MQFEKCFWLTPKRTMLFSLCVFGLALSPQAIASTAGAACTVSGAVERDSGQTLICNGSVWKEVEQTSTAGRKVVQINEDVASCTSDKTGRISYDATDDKWTYCNGSSWLPFDKAGCQGPADCDVPGEVCTDGTVFAGCAGEDYHWIFTSRCDVGQTWNGAACTGTAVQYRWADASGSTNLRATGVTSKTTGQANTTALTNGVIDGTGDARSTAGLQPHNAAQYCQDLSANGAGDSNPVNGTVYTDWHLPAGFELATLFYHRTAIGNFGALQFWSSSEASATGAGTIGFNTGAVSSAGKGTNSYVRCVRLK